MIFREQLNTILKELEPEGEDDGGVKAEHFRLGGEMAYHYLSRLFENLNFQVEAYKEIRKGLAESGLSAIDELWAEIGLRQPQLKREMEMVAKSRGFFDDWFVEGALAVLCSYWIEPDQGYVGALQPDLVEN